MFVGGYTVFTLSVHKPYCNGMYVLYIFYMHFTLIVSVFMLSICDTEINQSIKKSFCACVRNILFPSYLEESLMEFHQILQTHSYVQGK